jgi:hypothetical protein
MKNGILSLAILSTCLFALVGTVSAQLPHIVMGTVVNPDSSVPALKEIMFRAYLTKAPHDTSAPDSCAAGGGWAVEVIYDIPNSTWAAGDTVVVIFKNIGASAYAGALTKLVYKTTSVSPEVTGKSALPVEMTTFDAIVHRGSLSDEVVLNWRTVGETNNYGFEVQRSVDGKDFSKIGFVSGAGSTNIGQTYQFIDRGVDIGVYFYRLKQIDTNGSFSLTETKEVAITPPESYELSQNFPNPFNPQTDIIFRLKEEGRVTIAVYDVLGREVARVIDEKMKVGSHRVTFDGRNLPTGMYLYSMKAGEYHQIKKMALIK